MGWQETETRQLRYKILADRVFNMKAFALNDTYPVFIDTVVTDYCHEGMRTYVKDEAFYRDFERIFRECFGDFLFFASKCKVVLRNMTRATKEKLPSNGRP